MFFYHHSVSCVVVSALWLLWFGLLPGTFLATWITGQNDWSRFWWLSSVILAICAWSNWGMHRRDRFGRACAFVAMGMTLGMLADLYGTFKILRFTEPLPVIIPLFALGHVGYIGGMVVLAGNLGWTGKPHWARLLASTIVLYNLVGLALWLMLVHSSDALPAMHGPTAGYTFLLATAAAVMATVAFCNRQFWAVGIGGLLFLVSDGFLAIRLFQDNWHGIGDLCWITYGIGQMLIVYGTIAGTWPETRIPAA